MNLETLRPLFFTAAKSTKAGDKTGDAAANAYLNIAYIEVFESHRWHFRQKTGQVTLFPFYTTGTCTVTKFDGTNSAAAKTVTFSTAPDASYVGRYFRAQSSSNWHKIVYISGTTAYLDSEIVDVDSGGGKTFEIWKRFYYLKSDVDVLHDFGKWANGRLAYKSESDLVDQITDLSETGDPGSYSPYGVDPYDDTEYSTGTIEVAADSNIVTGSDGTAWLSAGYDTGDIMVINTLEYYIKRVESNTRIILFNYVTDAISAGTTYTLRKNNPPGFEFWNASDDYRSLPYTYLSRAYPLIHLTKDRIQLSRRFIPAIVSRAVYYAMRDADDDRYGTMLAIYNAELDSLKQKVRVVEPRYHIFAPKIPNYMPGRG